MIPVLFSLGPVKIYTLGVFLVIALLWALFLFWKNIKLTAYKEDNIFDAVFFSLIGALLFSRLVFVLLNFSDFGFDVLKFILINGYPGLSMYGALFGGYLFAGIYCYINKIEYKKIIDYSVGPLFFALAIGKIGSFFSGVDVGVKTSLPLSTHYLGYDSPRHITALYEAVLFGVGFVFTQKLLFKIRREQLNSGDGFIYFMLYFSLAELLLDKMKENHLYFAGFSFNWLVSVVICVVTILYFIIQYRNKIISRLKEIKTFAINKYAKKNKQNIYSENKKTT